MDNPKKEELLKMTLEEIQKIVEKQRRDIEDYENSQKQKLIDEFFKNQQKLNDRQIIQNNPQKADNTKKDYTYLNYMQTKRQNLKTSIIEELGSDNKWHKVPFNDYEPYYSNDGYYYCYDKNDNSLWVSSNNKDWKKMNDPTKASQNTSDNPQPANAQPTNAQPANAQPANAQPANVQPTNAQPANAQPANAQPANAQPANAQPANAQPANAQPANAQPANAQPANAQPANAQPANAQPANAQPANAQPANANFRPSVTYNQQTQTQTQPFNYNNYDYSRGNHLTKYQKIEKDAENYVEGQKATSSFKRIMKKIGTGFGVALGAGIALNSFGLAVPIGAVGMLLKSVDKEKELDERDAKIKGDIYEKEEKLKITGYGPARNKLQNELNDARIEENLIEATRRFRFKEFLRTSVKWAGIVGTIGTALVSFPVGLGAAAVAGIGVEWSKSDSKTKEKEDAYLEKVRQEELAKLRYAQQQYLAYQAARNNQAVQQQTNNNPIIVPNNVLIGNQQMQNSQGGRTL